MFSCRIGGQNSQKNVNSRIAFITTHAEMVFLTLKYQIEALNFILKDLSDEIQDCVTKAIKTCNKEFMNQEISSTEYYQLKTGDHIRLGINLVKIVTQLYFS